MPRFYWFSYAVSERERQRKPPARDVHKVRDGGTFADLASVLFCHGFEYSGMLLNLPENYAIEDRESNDVPMATEDMIVLATRPPLDDHNDSKAGIRRSETKLEKQVFDQLRRVFAYLDRGEVSLSECVSNCLPETVKPYASVEFGLYRDANVAAAAGLPLGTPGLTLAYLVSIPGKRFRLVSAFGMSGRETMTWGYLLRTTFRDPLDAVIKSREIRLLVGGFQIPEVPYPYQLVGCDPAKLSASIFIDTTVPSA